MKETHLYGLDFTSAPRRGKYIMCAHARLSGSVLDVTQIEPLPSFSSFEALLRRSGPWVAGIDAPFGQPRRLVHALDWPQTWTGYVQEVAALGKAGFEQTLRDYTGKRPLGDKQHRRVTDALAGAASPMALHYVPVGKMFYELAPRLLRTTLNVVPLRETDDDRTVLEVYPALVTRQLIGSRKYKSDTKQKQTEGMRETRHEIVQRLRSGLEGYGLTAQIGDVLATYLIDDATGDALDAVLCTVQAAWAAGQEHCGVPGDADRLEGWIADPALISPDAKENPAAAKTERRAA